MDGPEYAGETMDPGSPDEDNQASDSEGEYFSDREESGPTSPKDFEQNILINSTNGGANPLLEDISADDSSQCATSQDRSPVPMEADSNSREPNWPQSPEAMDDQEGPMSPMDQNSSSDSGGPQSPDSSQPQTDQSGWNLIPCDQESSRPTDEVSTNLPPPKSPSASPSESGGEQVDDDDTFSLGDPEPVSTVNNVEKSNRVDSEINEPSTASVQGPTSSPNSLPCSPTSSPPMSPEQSDSHGVESKLINKEKELQTKFDSEKDLHRTQTEVSENRTVVNREDNRHSDEGETDDVEVESSEKLESSVAGRTTDLDHAVQAKVRPSLPRGSLHDHDHEPELDYDETELDDSLTHRKSDKEADRSKDLEDGEEAEEGEEEEEEKKKENKSDDDDDDGELDDDDDCEEGEIKDPEGRKPYVRPTCRFYTRGNCTWGNNCRFLHPGVNDKGNYSMIERPGMPGPGLWTRDRLDSRENERETREKEQEEEEPAPPPAPEPREETAWERGLRQAKELMKKANKRKEMETNFEEKRLNLSTEDDREYNKENDRGRIIRDPYYDNIFDDEEDDYYGRPAQQDNWGPSGYENFEVRWTREPDYPPSYRGPPSQPPSGPPPMKERDRLRERHQRERRFSPPPNMDRPDKRYDRVRKEDYDRISPRDRDMRDPRDRRDMGRDMKEMRDERLPPDMPPPRVRGDEWTDPWRRSKSPKRRRDSSSRSRSRGRRRYRRSASGSSYSSGSSRSSRSRSSSYSSYTSRSSYSRSSSYSSRSSSGSRSRSPPRRKRPIPARPTGPPRSGGPNHPGLGPPRPAGPPGPAQPGPTKQPGGRPPTKAPPPTSKPPANKTPAPSGPSAPGPANKTSNSGNLPRGSATSKGQQRSPEKKYPSSGPNNVKPSGPGKLSPPRGPPTVRVSPGGKGPTNKSPAPARGPPAGKPAAGLPPAAGIRGRKKERRPYRSGKHSPSGSSDSSSRSRSRSFSSSSSRSGSASSISSISSSSSSSSSGSADSDNLYRDIKSKNRAERRKKGPAGPAAPNPPAQMEQRKRLPSSKERMQSPTRERLRDGKDIRERERKLPPPRNERVERPERVERMDHMERQDSRTSRMPEPPQESRVRSSVSQGLVPTNKAIKDPMKLSGEKSKIKLTLISKPKPGGESGGAGRKRPSGDPSGGPPNKRPPKSPSKPMPPPDMRAAGKAAPKQDKIAKPISPKGKEPVKPATPTKKTEPAAKQPTKAAPAPAAKAKKSTSSRREELLKQLKAVEDAIARKRAKMS